MSASKLSLRSRAVLAAIRRRGSASRSELIRDLGLSGTAVFRATEELEAAGFVRSGETVASGRGQPSAMIHIEPDMAFSIGISVMTDRADVVLVDLTGAIRARREITLPGMPRAGMVDAAVAFALDHMATAGIDRRRLLGLGVAVAGYFVGPSMVNPGLELEEWALIDLHEAIERQTGLPVVIENIASAAALGERMLGVAARYDSFCYVNVAAGFGAGIVMNGALVRGRHGNAGEIAGLFASGGRITPNLVTLRDRLADHGITCTGMSDLIARFDPAWPGVEEWLAEHQASFSYLFGVLRMTLDCEALILGGRLPRVLARRIVDGIDLPEQHWPVRRERRAPPTMMDVASLEPELSGPLGAASLMFHQTVFD